MLRFPQREEVRLQRSPLKEVICQVRFPTILRIANEEPVEFQERVRQRFPQLGIEHAVVVQMDSAGTSPPPVQPGPRIYRFSSPDGQTMVSLAPDFYALSTTFYSHWKDFLETLNLVNLAANEVYALPYATRVGLRYINHLTLENTKTQSITELWDILRPELTTMLRVDLWDEPLEMLSYLSLSAGENERLTLRSGFKGGKEPVFELDFDRYTDAQVGLDNLSMLCQRYHDDIYNAFRWCIREEKLGVFAPTDVED